MELRHLRYFVAIAEERSITRAAERLWIAQPGLSTQIRRLEDELGIKLFDRHTRGVDLTAAGEVFLERARAALDAAELARSTGRNLEAGLIGTVRLGIASETPTDDVPSLLQSFGDERPDVDVTVFESYSGTLMRDLRDGRLDAVAAPAGFASPDLRSTAIGTESWTVLVGPRHRLASPGTVAAEELRGVPIVVTGHRDAAGYDRAVAETLTELGITPVLTRGGPGPALLAAVAAGTAVALTTAPAAAGRGLVARELERAPRLRFALVSRDETPAPALRELIRTAEARRERVRPPARPALVSVA